VESELGRGSCFGFSLTLPLAEAATPAPARGPIRPDRVLVVDDQVINRTILDRQLGAQGLNVTLAASAAEGIALAGRPDCGFDLILTDQEMPGMNGLDMVLALRAAGSTVPVLLLSSSPTVGRDHPGAAELIGILQKPVLRRDLMRQLRSIGAPPGEPDAASPVPVALPDLSGAGRRMRVLTAEDNLTNRLVFAKMVADLDLDVDFAENGREAVEKFVAQRPDLIFMDISMPEMDGREATRAIRQLPGGAQTAIVALTAHAMQGNEGDFLAAGLDHCLTKPLRKALLHEMLERYHPPEARALRPPMSQSA
jgi:CheY-like chemotaxis protein